jgi:molybdate transport system permease protein
MALNPGGDENRRLRVQIERHLASFSLQVDFCAGPRPLGILGGSGAGKTMTLRAIAGLEGGMRGRIELGARVLFDSASRTNLPARARRVGMVFQHYALFPHLTVEQNIAFGLPRTERHEAVAVQIDKLRLHGLEQRYPRELSGGQQQRAALARALAREPAALLLDEPLAALDPHLRPQLERELGEVLAQFRGPALFVSHNLEELYRLCSELLVLHEGRVAASGPKEQIFARPPNLIVARLTGCKNFSRAHRLAPDEVQAEDWGVRLRLIPETGFDPKHVAIRAHHLAFLSSGEAAHSQPANTFPCWLSGLSETPFRVTLYLRLGGPPTDPTDFHLQAELFKDRFTLMRDWPQPWQVRLDPERLFPLPD